MGSFAYVNKLTRSKVGDFVIEEAISSKDLLEMDKDQILSRIKPVDYALKDYKEIRLDESYFKQATNGMTMRVDDIYSDDLIRVYVDDKFIGLAKNFKNEDRYFLKMEKVFYEK